MRKHDIFLLLFIALVIAFLPTESIGAAKRDSSNAPFATTQITSGGAGGVPVGTIIAWPVASDPEDPENWLECNGQAIDRTVYPELFAVIGSKTPDLRGIFLRGYGSQNHSQNNGSIVGMTSTLYESEQLGIIQGDASRKITGISGFTDESGHKTMYDSTYYSGGITGLQDGGAGGRVIRIDTSREIPTADENRPVNIAVRYLIRAIP